MKIGILGGRFDPVHIAHIRAAIEFYEQVNLDRLIVVPAGVPAHKKVVASAEDRFHMTQLAFKTLKFAEIDDYEIKSRETSYTVNSLKYYKKKYPGSTLFYLVGLDEFINIRTWKDWNLCLELANFVVVERRTNFQSTDIEEDCEKISMRTLDISSSEIRMMIEHEKMVDYLLPEAVKRYIEQEGLYR